MDYDKLMERARAVNRKRDVSESQAGWGTPSGGPLIEHIRTAMMAIEAGIRTGNWATIAEGQAMLEDVLERMKP